MSNRALSIRKQISASSPPHADLCYQTYNIQAREIEKERETGSHLLRSQVPSLSAISTRYSQSPLYTIGKSDTRQLVLCIKFELTRSVCRIITLWPYHIYLICCYCILFFSIFFFFAFLFLTSLCLICFFFVLL